ncbi:MAG: 8-amino-7-oxononanoate synthase [Candidatus Fraserbacteria bacterium RBG_16_55_9]|uniref:8-amino-7-oxononanoate synthase n=1 Tax=Fraserbacteria sp. (strain RBG_16_55_9) TaxID=1817864 RepID=A0A1F5V1A9_FRAXR|nr:MAG: 8-amino-7-oxononanoate synthase [Candidatus Fraserbacteria bacterium RBG_16_55_9]
MDLFSKCESFVTAKEAKALGYYPYFKPVSTAEDTEVIIEGRQVLMLGSNNYLGLTTHPKVKQAAVDAIKRYGTSSCGSRFLNGTLDLHHELEHRLARFLKREAALVFSTGFQTNLGTISAIIGKDDILISDKWNHASIIDGARLSYGKMKRYRHNDMEDLEKVLQDCPEEAGKLVVVDGLFSMEGDLAPLPRIVKLAHKHGARMMVDDAHGLGVMGRHGRGTAEHFGVEDDVDLVMGTFSKSFASLGGVIAGEEYVISYIQHHARSMIFSASMPPSAVATVIAALEVIEAEPDRRKHLWKNTQKMMKGLKALGFDTGHSETPVIPIVVGDMYRALHMWKSLFESGVYANVVLPPAVPKGRALLRTSYMATHTEKQLDFALGVFENVGKECNLI